MSKVRSSKRTKRKSDDLLPEYDFDYSKGRRNPYAKEYKTGSRVVVLDPDVAKIFKTGDSVNNALRAILTAFPARRRQKT